MSREKILQTVKQNKPPLTPLPDLPEFEQDADSFLENFMGAIEKAAGKVHLLTNGESLDDIIRSYYPQAERIICRVKNNQLGTVELDQLPALTDLHGLDLAILPAQVGVVENGAMWLSETDMGQRIVPFIAEHLVLVIDRKNLLGDMHQAYQKIKIDKTGFGLFIAGPSKTADIEQSLVIGAQGPRTWLVLIQ